MTHSDDSPRGLDEIWSECRISLEQIANEHSVRDRIIALGYEGNAATIEQAYLIVRHFDPVRMALTLFTDQRSGKWAALRRKPDISLLYFAQHSSLQLRLHGSANIIHGGDHCQSCWDAMPDYQKSAYAQRHPVIAPGAALMGTNGYGGAHLSEDDRAKGINNFGILEIIITSCRFLKLQSHGNIAGVFSVFQKGSPEKSEWDYP